MVEKNSIDFIECKRFTQYIDEYGVIENFSKVERVLV